MFLSNLFLILLINIFIILFFLFLFYFKIDFFVAFGLIIKKIKIKIYFFFKRSEIVCCLIALVLFFLNFILQYFEYYPILNFYKHLFYVKVLSLSFFYKISLICFIFILVVILLIKIKSIMMFYIFEIFSPEEWNALLNYPLVYLKAIVIGILAIYIGIEVYDWMMHSDFYIGMTHAEDGTPVATIKNRVKQQVLHTEIDQSLLIDIAINNPNTYAFEPFKVISNSFGSEFFRSNSKGDLFEFHHNPTIFFSESFVDHSSKDNAVETMVSGIPSKVGGICFTSFEDSIKYFQEHLDYAQSIPDELKTPELTEELIRIEGDRMLEKIGVRFIVHKELFTSRNLLKSSKVLNDLEHHWYVSGEDFINNQGQCLKCFFYKNNTKG